MNKFFPAVFLFSFALVYFITPASAEAAFPAYRASGTFTANALAITPPYPTGVVPGEICLLVVTSENQAISLTTANGFVQISLSPQSAGTAATNPASRMAVYWKRTAGGDAAPVVADSGDNNTGVIHCFTGVIQSGNPWDVISAGNDLATNDTTGNIPGATTTVAETLVVLINSTSVDATGTTNFSAWANANLANIVERQDNSSNAGFGGGSGMATGEKGTAGAYATSTVTLAATSFKGAISIALKPPTPPLLITQEGYIFENNDNVNTNDADGNTQQAQGSTTITSVKKGERITARFHIKNTSTASSSANAFGLFYDRNDGIWTQVRANGIASTSLGNCVDTNWDCIAVDTTNVVGGYSSLAFDPTGIPWVSYQDATNFDLRVARYVGSGGTGCATAAWTCTAVHTATAVGKHTSIAFAKGSTTPWVSYQDGTPNFDLRVARYVGSGGTGCATTEWTCTAIDTAMNAEDTSLAFDSAGNLWLSYYDESNFNFRVARYVVSGGTGCATTAWTCTTIDSLHNSGHYTSLAFDTGGNPWVSYYEGDELLNGCTTDCNLRVARYVVSGGTGCATTAWTCTVVDSTNNVGYYTSLAFDPTGNAWVSYYDQTNGDFRVARYVVSGGTGCASSAWTCATVQSTNDVGYYTSLAFDPNGNPWVSYYEAGSPCGTGGNCDLRVARYVGSGGTGCAIATWTCTSLDTTNDVGWYTSLAFDPTGTPWVSHYDNTNGDLRIARIKRAGEIVISPSLGWGIGTSTYLTSTSTRESHADMLSVTDTTGRDDADCLTAGATWNNGLAFQSEQGTGLVLPAGNVTPQCTEVSFTIDTAQAIQGRTYRLVLATKDSFRFDKGIWLGPISTASSSFPTFIIDTATTSRLSKDSQYKLPNCADANWGCMSIDTTNVIGTHTSLALDPAGNPWVSYYDDANFNFRIARYVGSGGTGCAVATWTCVTIDTTNLVGTYSSLAFDPNGNPWVSYYEANTASLRVARYVGSGGTGCAVTSWTCTAVETANDVGSDTSLAFDPAGNPWVSYFDATNFDLRIARYVGSGGTGCASTEWTCTAVDTTNNVGLYTSLAFAPTGNPWVSYYDATNFDLRIARYVGSGGTGCVTSAWACTAVDTAGSVGTSTSLAFDPAGNPWVSYFDATNFDLRVARYVGAGGTGCASTEWTCTAVDTTNTVGEHTSLAFDSVGNPWVSYYDATNTNLRITHYVGSSGTGCASAAWTCTAVDAINDVGWDTSIAFDYAGTPWVSYYDNTTFDLRIAKLHLPPTKLSATSSIAFPGRSAGRGDLRYRLDSGKSPRTDADGTCSGNTDRKGYCGVSADDTHFDRMSAYASETPMFAGAFRASANTITPTVTWKGQSSTAPSSKNINIQVYRFGTVNAWINLTTTTNTCTSTGANTNCAIVGATTTDITELFEQDGTDYWVYVRVYQAEDAVAMTLKTNQFSTVFAQSANVTLLHYRWRNDDGAQTGASWVTNENTPITSATSSASTYKGDRKRLRLTVSNAGGADATNFTYRLDYSSSSCATFIPVPTTVLMTSEEWVMDLSQYVADGLASTALLTVPSGKSFVGGEVRVYSNSSSAKTLTSTQYSEFEYGLRSTTIAQTNLLYCFRLTNAGVSTNFTYTVQPQITLSGNQRPTVGGGGIESLGGGAAQNGGSGRGGGGLEGGGGGGPVGGGGGGGGGGLE